MSLPPPPPRPPRPPPNLRGAHLPPFFLYLPVLFFFWHLRPGLPSQLYPSDITRRGAVRSSYAPEMPRTMQAGKQAGRQAGKRPKKRQAGAGALAPPRTHRRPGLGDAAPFSTNEGRLSQRGESRWRPLQSPVKQKTHFSYSQTYSTVS